MGEPFLRRNFGATQAVGPGNVIKLNCLAIYFSLSLYTFSLHSDLHETFSTCRIEDLLRGTDASHFPERDTHKGCATKTSRSAHRVPCSIWIDDFEKQMSLGKEVVPSPIPSSHPLITGHLPRQMLSYRSSNSQGWGQTSKTHETSVLESGHLGSFLILEKLPILPGNYLSLWSR